MILTARINMVLDNHITWLQIIQPKHDRMCM